jgi:hypothetical protein
VYQVDGESIRKWNEARQGFFSLRSHVFEKLAMIQLLEKQSKVPGFGQMTNGIPNLNEANVETV